VIECLNKNKIRKKHQKEKGPITVRTKGHGVKKCCVEAPPRKTLGYKSDEKGVEGLSNQADAVGEKMGGGRKGVDSSILWWGRETVLIE